MDATTSTNETLRAENAELRARLEEAEEMLRAIRADEVDALIVETAAGPKLFTLQGVDAEQNRIRGEMLAQVSDAVIAVDAEDRIIFLNAAAERLLGVRAGDVLGCALSDIYIQQWENPAAEAGMWTALHERGECRCELIHRMHDGRERHVEQLISTLRAPDGTPTGYVKAIRDITARKEIEETLRVSEDRFRLAAQAVNGIIYEYDFRTGRVERTRGLHEVLGYRPYEVPPTAAWWHEQTHPDDRETNDKLYANLNLVGDSVVSEYRVRHRDGRWLHVEDRAVLLRSVDGDLVKMVGCTVDITDRKREETLLKVSETRYRRLFESAKDGILILDAHAATITDANPFIAEMLGYSQDEFVGMELWQIGLFQDVEANKAAMRELQEKGYIRYEDLPLKTKAGHRINVEFVSNVYVEDGEAVIQCNIRDISDRKRLEESLRRHAAELSEVDRRKDEFLATLAHELRNPLAPIRSGVAILRMTRAPEIIEKTLGMMDRQLVQLVDLVDDLLDLSRVRSGKITLRTDRVTVREAVDAAVEACRPTVDAKGHSLETTLPAEPLAIDGDKTRLVQAITNLLTNAAKYSKPGGHIRVAVVRDGGEAVVRVSDTGLGIAPETIPTLWDMFTQVRDTLDKAQGGLGIGLSLVKKLVEMHGGTVAAESPGIGKGSTFTLRLPLAAANVTEPPPDPSPGRDGTARTAARRVLVVDDSADGAASLSMLLDICGHETRTVHTGPAALAAARAFDPEVVFLDIGLPDGMDGYEVARRLRADPNTAGTVLVAVTGWGSPDHKQRTKDAGFDFHLTKPVDPAALDKLLGELKTSTE